MNDPQEPRSERARFWSGSGEPTRRGGVPPPKEASSRGPDVRALGAPPAAARPFAKDWSREIDPGDELAHLRKAELIAAAPAEPERAGSPRRDSPSGPAPRTHDVLAILGGLLFGGATLLMAFRAEPFRTWYYLFAWYPFLLLVNRAAAARSPRHSIFAGRLWTTLGLLAWSVPVWIFFEAWNLRLENWYYIGVPDGLLARRIGVILSFATVLPGVFFLEELLAVRGWFDGFRSKGFSVTGALKQHLAWIGGGLSLMILALPSVFFPVLWGVPLLLLEPWLATRDEKSLLAELSSGKFARTFRLLVAGLVCGIFWEAANYFAGGKWVYTVPGFENRKLFEMPLFGFFGFAPFALSCWSMARALRALGLIGEWDLAPAVIRRGPNATRSAPTSRGVRLAVAIGAPLFCLLVLAAMDRWTIDSFAPRVENVPGIADGVAEYSSKRGGGDIRGLLKLIERGDLYIPGRTTAEANELLAERCRLVLLAGLGTANVARLDRVGVRTVEELAACERDELCAKLAEIDEPGWRVRPRRVGVWIEAARSR